jgi:hypothetical protein
MLVEKDISTYRRYFPVDSNPFISERFIELNRDKVDRIIRLVDESGEPVIGLVAGIKDGILKSPFSAPFGGFHFRKENIYISEIDRFLQLLSDYAAFRSLSRIEIITPPDLYHMTFNAKLINSLIRHGYYSALPDITNWVDLALFNGVFSQKNSREYFRQAERNNLVFSMAQNDRDREGIYKLICENRAKFGRPVYMTLDDILSTGLIWPAEFFKVESAERQIVASAIFYRSHDDICYAVFWGDNDEGRPLRAMDFLLLNLFAYYKEAGFRYIDLGISTENGIPNEGLLRFKESHEAFSSLRYRFMLEIKKN